MDSDTIVTLAILIVLLLLSAYFGATETAFSTLNRIRVKNMSENGSKRAALVLNLYDNYDRLISTILVGNNIVNISAATLSAVLFIRHFGDLGATLSTVIITVVVLVFGEVTPKSLAKEKPEKFAFFSAPILYFFMVILTPVNYLFARWKKFLSTAFFTEMEDRSITEEELLTMVEEAEQDGAINEEDKQLINNAIEFNDVRAEDILTPRMKIAGVPRDVSVEDMAERFLQTGYSRIPVYQETIDNIVGVVHIRDFLEYMIKREKSPESIISPVVYTTPSIRISGLLKLLQKEKSHIAVVTDEYGGTEGIVTMEDILEELVGEIWDESDEIIEEFIDLGDRRHKVLCSADIEKFFAYFDLETEEEADSSTVGGWIMDNLDKVPQEGDAFTYENLRITVHKAEQRRVLECIVCVLNEEAVLEELPDKLS